MTAERFAQGLTFEQYVAYTGTPENLAREAGWWLGRRRVDFSGVLRQWYDRALYRYFEFPAIYHKMRLAEAMQVAKPGENREQAWDRFIRDWRALQESPFFPMWASAAVDEMLSALHERMVVGPGPA